jgi:hypothetical protein
LQQGLSLLVKMLWGVDVEPVPGEEDDAYVWALNRALAEVVRQQAGGRGKARGAVTPPDLFKLQQQGNPGLTEKAGPALYL